MAATTIQVKVKPNARASALREPVEGTVWVAQVQAPPVEGRANAELVALVARHFGCSKSQVTIKRGKTGRMKIVQIENR